jgi:2-C-methyl-D-erythritol 2,4-cyclodiphosphate synthase
MRVGFGYDVHRLVSGRKLILGGVEVAYETGLEGHSDADVLVHSLCDALLGAAALGDIGQHFPDSDPRYQNISSLVLLQETATLIRKKGYRIQNTDSTIVAQEPRLAGFIDRMRENIATTLNISSDSVSVKATTTEGLGFTGAKEGIASYSVVLIKAE